MRLDNEFVVPRPVDQAWAVLTDVERIAPCMPGAQLGEIEGDNYHGTVKVKVGPVVAQYAGVARFRELDPANHRAVLEANGKQRNGNGRASAVVTADLTGEGDSTRVKVTTDLTIAGALAQFGRGAIAEVSGKLLGQFVDRLKETVLADEGQPAAGPGTAPEPAGAATPAEASAPPEAGGSAPSGAAAPAAGAAPPAAVTAPQAATGPVAGAPSAAPVAGAAGPAQPAPQPAPQPSPARPAPASAEVASVDLLRVAGPAILKRVLPLLVVLAAVIVILVLWLG